MAPYGVKLLAAVAAEVCAEKVNVVLLAVRGKPLGIERNDAGAIFVKGAVDFSRATDELMEFEGKGSPVIGVPDELGTDKEGFECLPCLPLIASGVKCEPFGSSGDADGFCADRANPGLDVEAHVQLDPDRKRVMLEMLERIPFQNRLAYPGTKIRLDTLRCSGGIRAPFEGFADDIVSGDWLPKEKRGYIGDDFFLLLTGACARHRGRCADAEQLVGVEPLLKAAH
ncbi:MAG: hypothetical protein BWY82_00378 [Verrucomicrobia bacterium ADurb.Bin474]|nr:MAG: hypothetical protein BWY82_00378 [Verrucomicrobia bacterium ADurb.Bin474]